MFDRMSERRGPAGLVHEMNHHIVQQEKERNGHSVST